MSYEYRFEYPGVEKWFGRMLSPSWVCQELPWDKEVQAGALMLEAPHSLLAQLPEYRSLSLQQQEEIRLKECIYHLSNLLAGEHKAVTLAGQVLVGLPSDVPDWQHSMSLILSDETKHFFVLSRYLHEKVGLCYQPHPRIQEIIQALEEEEVIEVKLFVSQVVLEWTATSLLASLLFKSPEPLLKKILQRILQDEGRHLGFSRLFMSHQGAARLAAVRRPLEDLIFETIVAVISSFCAIPVWQEFGLSRESCRQYAVQQMEAGGVFNFYRDILPRELARWALYSDRLRRLLHEDLTNRIINDHWSFEPKKEATP